MKIKVKISKNLKIGDIGSIFSIKKVDNGMKPVSGTPQRQKKYIF